MFFIALGYLLDARFQISIIVIVSPIRLIFHPIVALFSLVHHDLITVVVSLVQIHLFMFFILNRLVSSAECLIFVKAIVLYFSSILHSFEVILFEVERDWIKLIESHQQIYLFIFFIPHRYVLMTIFLIFVIRIEVHICLFLHSIEALLIEVDHDLTIVIMRHSQIH